MFSRSDVHSPRALAEQADQWLKSMPGYERAAPSREALVRLGAQIWPLSYAQTDDDQTAFVVLSETVHREALAGDPVAATMDVALHLPNQQMLHMFAARWVDQGLPVVTMGHKYAAALMATTVSPDAADAIRPPWKAFLVEVPTGLLSVHDPSDGTDHAITLLAVQQMVTPRAGGGMEPTWHYIAIAPPALTLWKHGVTTEQLIAIDTLDVEGMWAGSAFLLASDDQDERVHVLVARFILGICLAMSDKRNVSPIGKAHAYHAEAVRQRKRPEPIARVFQIGQPIKIDARQAVRDYVLHGGRRGKSPTVQVLVRGHWKTQPYGPRSTLRKVIWREPFWRGPEDAPILARPVKLNNQEAP